MGRSSVAPTSGGGAAALVGRGNNRIDVRAGQFSSVIVLSRGTEARTI